jgi:hypothetical protein
MDRICVRERGFPRLVEIYCSALDGAGTSAESGGRSRVEMELISLTRATFISAESVGGDFSTVAAEGVLGSGEGLGG